MRKENCGLKREEIYMIFCFTIVLSFLQFYKIEAALVADVIAIMNHYTKLLLFVVIPFGSTLFFFSILSYLLFLSIL